MPAALCWLPWPPKCRPPKTNLLPSPCEQSTRSGRSGAIPFSTTTSTCCPAATTPASPCSISRPPPRGARVVINDAISEQTEERIIDLIPEGVITDLTRLVLTNAVYFKANWLNEFNPEATADGTFETAVGNEVTVPMMHTTIRTRYVDGDNYVAAWLPYVGDATMIVILPDNDVAGLLETLSVERTGRGQPWDGVASTST